MLKFGVKKYIFITLGTISLALGVIGIFLPILPTIPFMLLTSYFYVRSSDSLHSWLINHRICGRYIQDYVEKREVPRKAKIVALSTLWPSLLFTMTLVNWPHLRILLGVIGLLVSLHIINLGNSGAQS